MKPSELSLKIKKQFAYQSVISTHEITSFLIKEFPNLAANTISWKINQLKSENHIQQVGRGIYTFHFKPEYTPELSLKTKRIYNRVKPLCKDVFSVWDTDIINKISGKSINKHWIFLSTSKENLEPLFDNMLDFSKQVFLQPDKEIISRYLYPHEDAIILSPLISETPLDKSTDYISPTIEGILVNTWLKFDNYLKPIGFDLEEIFKQAFAKYNINQSRLLRYASRRDKREEIDQLIKKIQ